MHDANRNGTQQIDFLDFNTFNTENGKQMRMFGELVYSNQASSTIVQSTRPSSISTFPTKREIAKDNSALVTQWSPQIYTRTIGADTICDNFEDLCGEGQPDLFACHETPVELGAETMRPKHGQTKMALTVTTMVAGTWTNLLRLQTRLGLASNPETLTLTMKLAKTLPSTMAMLLPDRSVLCWNWKELLATKDRDQIGVP